MWHSVSYHISNGKLAVNVIILPSIHQYYNNYWIAAVRMKQIRLLLQFWFLLLQSFTKQVGTSASRTLKSVLYCTSGIKLRKWFKWLLFRFSKIAVQNLLSTKTKHYETSMPTGTFGSCMVFKPQSFFNKSMSRLKCPSKPARKSRSTISAE